MKSRPPAALALAAAALVAASALASPALAASAAYVKQGSYGWPDQCQWFGQQGQTNHTWSSYYCETVIPTNWTAPGLYNLWVQY
jgi:Spy/CpxP family protein refolding chaperone